MTNVSPILIAGAVVLVLGAIGAVVFLMRGRRTFAGYREIVADVKSLAKALNGEVFRDGNDLVLSGEYQGIPTILRFSNEESTPAMNLEMRIPATFQLAIYPRLFSGNMVGRAVKLSLWLDQRFNARSKDANDVELLMTQRAASGVLERLCCSQKVLLEINPGKLQLAHMVTPDEVHDHVTAHLSDVRELTQLMAAMPGSDTVKIKAIPRERSSWTFRAAVAGGIAAAALCVLAATREHSQPPAPKVAITTTVNGIQKSDAALIPFVEDWHLAESGDFDAGFADFVNAAGQHPAPRVEFRSDPAGPLDGVAYLLVNQQGQKRFVMLVDHRRVFDSGFPSISGIARVAAGARSDLHSAQTADKPSGDGILMVRQADDPKSSVLLFVQNGTVRSGTPSDYRQVDVSSAVDEAAGQ